MARETVLIGVQARSGSTRLPNKAHAPIAGRTMLDCVVGACRGTANFLMDRGDVDVIVAVLCPVGDPIADIVYDAKVIPGPAMDVLERYRRAAAQVEADYVVRITGDCPLIPSFVISRHVQLALQKRYDYVSNVDERFRTTLDGADCEVISRRLLDDTAARADTPDDREHVTTLIRRSPPPWASIGVVVNHFDLSWLKLSVDTEEDLARVRKAAESAKRKYRDAAATMGRGAVHTI